MLNTKTSVGNQSVNRALEMLIAICQADSSLSLSQLSEQSQLNKSTVHRLLQSLVAYGLVNQEPLTKHYTAGLTLLNLAGMVLDKIDLRAQSAQDLSELNQQTGETVHLAILDKGEVVYIDKRESVHVIRMYSAIGKRGPAHCTGVGKALLAYLPPDQLRKIIQANGLTRYTPNTITDYAELERHLAEVRDKGYAIDNAEHEPEIMCVACPIFGHRGDVVAAISVTAPTIRANREKLEMIAPLVRHTADNISRKLGYTHTKGRSATHGEG